MTQTAEKAGETSKVNELVDRIGELRVLELVELVEKLKSRFGVSGIAAVAAAPGASAGAPAAAGPAEEKSTFDVILKSAGENKIPVIKAVRAVTSLGLKEAKELVESAPKPVKEGVTKEEAEKVKQELEKAGAAVELK